jgi:LacI family transcriptional regulator
VVALGHTRIGHVAGPQNLSTGHRRYLGFVESMHAAGLEAPEASVQFARFFTEEEGAVACSALLDADPQITAIVAGNDLLALGCYDTLRERGVSCPDDISIVGFNDMPFIARLLPPLTSVRIPQREVGTVAADLLLGQLADGAGPAREILLEPSLVIRGSTAPPRQR